MKAFVKVILAAMAVIAYAAPVRKENNVVDSGSIERRDSPTCPQGVKACPIHGPPCCGYHG
ncbi:hypothetical protein CERZMDRAFT_102627 [Cercospora zeae-maydis SCOH1-5]|uniref:Uncharacterized protein n=1 Tax=Cercospora zeae-maydis SCOH1-5 TaxID=717836 RepID=A0A6A6F1T7_9PEZI|nr:hypothetical protein CERZMDRAFT_102627 [Cercospora zeae-maydis SCOH1-5]